MTYKQTDDNKVIVYFIITEFPSGIQEIVYQGAKHLKPEELDSIVTCTAWLTAGGALDAPALPAQRATVVAAG